MPGEAIEFILCSKRPGSGLEVTQDPDHRHSANISPAVEVCSWPIIPIHCWITTSPPQALTVCNDVTLLTNWHSLNQQIRCFLRNPILIFVFKKRWCRLGTPTPSASRGCLVGHGAPKCAHYRNVLWILSEGLALFGQNALLRTGFCTYGRRKQSGSLSYLAIT